MPQAHDATVALLAVVVMFLIPGGRRDAAGRRASARLEDRQRHPVGDEAVFHVGRQVIMVDVGP